MHGLAAGDAAKDAAGVIAQKTFRHHLIAMLTAPLCNAGKAVADLHALHGIDRHHRRRQFGIEFAVNRFTPTRRHTQRLHINPRTHRIAGFTQRVEIRLQLGQLRGVGPEQAIGFHHRPVNGGWLHATHRAHAGAHPDAVLLRQPGFGNHAGGNAHCCFACGTATTTTRIANAVLLPIRVIGMTGPELLCDSGVILAARVGVADQQGNRSAGGDALVNAREYFNRIGLVPLRDMPRFTGGATRQVGNKHLRAQRKPRRAAIDHAANRRPVAFAKGGNAQQFSERVARHTLPSLANAISARPPAS